MPVAVLAQSIYGDGSNPTLSAFFEPLWFNYLRRKEGSIGVK